MLDKLQKWICRYVGASLAASLEPLAHHWNVASLDLFYRYQFGRCSSELAQLVPLPYPWGSSTHYFDRLHDFSVIIPWCYKDVYINSFFPCTARLWNALPILCFPLTYDLNDFNYWSNKHLLTVGSFFRGHSHIKWMGLTLTLRFATWNIFLLKYFWILRKKLLVWIKANLLKTHLILPKTKTKNLNCLYHITLKSNLSKTCMESLSNIKQ